MSGKSRRRGRHLSRSQRRKLGRGVYAPAASTTPTPAPTTSTPAAQQPAPAPQAETPVPAAKTVARTVAPSTNVSGELKRIGLVGGLIVAILVAAYFVLPLILD